MSASLVPSGFLVTLTNDLDRLFVCDKLKGLLKFRIAFVLRFGHLVEPNLHLVIDLLRNKVTGVRWKP